MQDAVAHSRENLQPKTGKLIISKKSIISNDWQ